MTKPLAAAVPDREWLTLDEAATWTGLSPATVRRAKRSGKLHPKKTADRGGRELYPIAGLRTWINGMEDA